MLSFCYQNLYMFSLGFEKLVFSKSHSLPLETLSKLWSGIYLKRDDAIKEEIGGLVFATKQEQVLSCISYAGML